MHLLLLAALGAALNASAPSRLDSFVGNWSGSGKMNVGTPTETSLAGINRCAWSEGKAFLICQGSATIGGKLFRGLSIFSYDEAHQKYHFLNISQASANRTELTVEGNTWTYSDTDTDKKGKTIYTRTLNIFDTPDRYRFINQRSGDRVHWKTTGSGVSTRIP
ncbi:MAG: DUF1579 domain-containing protein [Candidatus Eremiobacteraeota bacterium]|nr:DUF1579 domain-containing protein [Candidatus Eremiobacteraeota bacterium]